MFKNLEYYQDDLNYNLSLKELIFTSKYETVEEIMSYKEILDCIQIQDNPNPTECRFKRIISHGGPLPRKHPNYNASLYNVMMEWDNR